jgi:hypothetical protein
VDAFQTDGSRYLSVPEQALLLSIALPAELFPDGA